MIYKNIETYSLKESTKNTRLKILSKNFVYKFKDF